MSTPSSASHSIDTGSDENDIEYQPVDEEKMQEDLIEAQMMLSQVEPITVAGDRHNNAIMKKRNREYFKRK